MGWPEDVVLGSDVNAIVVARKGRYAMLRSIFGGAEQKPDADLSQREMTPELFDAVFG